MAVTGGGEVELSSFTLESHFIFTSHILATMEQWTIQHHVFTYDTFYLKWWICYHKTADLSSALQYQSEWHSSKLKQVFKMGWGVQNNKKNYKGKATRQCKNCEDARKHCQSESGILRSPRRSVHRHSWELYMCGDSVRKVLQLD